MASQAKNMLMACTNNTGLDMRHESMDALNTIADQRALDVLSGKVEADEVLKNRESRLEPQEEISVAEQKQMYFRQLKDISPCPETLAYSALFTDAWDRLSPEQIMEKRIQFNECKADLKMEWEALNQRSWPKYTTDVYSASGYLIRRAGNDYDAHHLRPLCVGGENTAENITPLHALDHYDKQGVHANDTPYAHLTDK